MPSRARTLLTTTGNYIVAHKIISSIVAVVLIGGIYWYEKAQTPAAPTRYILTTVQTGTVISTVSGSGQVSPSDQVTLNPKASGDITAVYVHDGQHVVEGQAIAQIDPTSALQSLQSAKNNLQSAQLSLQKLQQPATTLSVTQSQDAITKAQESEATAESNLVQTYQSGYNDTVATFLDLPAIMTGIKDIDIGTEATKGAQWNIDFYKSATENWDTNVDGYRDTAYNTYQSALTNYNSAYTDYQATSQNSSTSTIVSISKETYTLTQSVSAALAAANTLIQFYEDQVKAHNQTPNSEADSALTTLNSYITKINGHLNALLSDTNSIQSDTQQIADDQRMIVEDQQSLQQLQSGANNLDIQSAQLSIAQQEQAVTQAQTSLANYTIRAPFAGTLANFTLQKGDNVGSGTAAATEIGTGEIADLSLNEVDAAKVAIGNKATLTFDAVPNLSLTGQIVGISPLGTVAQGVVSYDVKISFDTQDSRIKAGMTVNADIQTAVHANVLTVPASAIKTLSGQTYVLAFNPPVADTGGTTGVTSDTAPQSIPVTVGISDNANTEITAGLSAGEQIVARTTGAATVTTTATAARSGFGGGGGGGTVLRGL